ncbi:Threonyl-tRNA synthetase [Caldanaerobacter subterraneus subsp. tengcongensis MB4]|uniref:Threonine--tRNA ligase n=2 Tax=Caldanaerobacter subterraneus TaxID=911092 RepID=SYT_CALS4|nr:RecName: Full=Threonine--tRNA ligase; AltName: Full=Threonyl-tRNA synthetase; Short=ThrRS [Caldanaerobacter subterraneus subsp. tengcongensis MB4]AAM24913.1 Threonyl-tRNA synthetase [Caldanaerobacter subterraneus subsp. tengcongensis MB4]
MYSLGNQVKAMVITLRDGTKREFEKGITVYEIAKSISDKLAREAVGGKFNGKIVELNTKIEEDGELEILTFEDEEGKKIYWHTSSHILAQAVKRLFKDVKLAIGPAIDNGFYYDFDTERPFTTEDFEAIEEEMNKIIKEDYKLERFVLSKEEAIKFMKEKDEPYKVELIEEIPEGEEISFYKQGEFVDLCAGPHLPSTGMVKAIKLLSVAGAYWKGDEKNKMLQRIYGISFPKKSMLDEYLHMMEEAKKRDHRKLGKELDLFSIHPEGPGFPFFHPKGMIIRNILEDFWRKEHIKRGYQEIRTPIILNEELWKRSGHWDHYKENMYFTEIDGQTYAIKPMNCPGAMLVYKSTLRSYRDLPLRLCELGLVHRHELSGVLHGLMRVRSFTQDDAHLFMTPEQVEDEILGVINLVDYFYKIFGFEYHVELSTRPENSMGTDEEWELATNALISALKRANLPYKVNEGEGAFYGPKIDFHLKDSIGRTWQCGTIQLDFQMPERFELEYIGPDGEKHRPIMLHRVIYGSIERFIGILTEHFAGAFPTWLAPVQVRVLPISEKHHEYARKVYERLQEHDIRVELDDRNEKIGYKIREAQLQKIPYMLIVGDREVEEGNVSLRSRKDGDLGPISLDNFIEKILKEIATKAL